MVVVTVDCGFDFDGALWIRVGVAAIWVCYNMVLMCVWAVWWVCACGGVGLVGWFGLVVLWWFSLVF